MKLNQLSNKFNHKTLNVSHLNHIFNSKNVTAIKFLLNIINLFLRFMKVYCDFSHVEDQLRLTSSVQMGMGS